MAWIIVHYRGRTKETAAEPWYIAAGEHPLNYRYTFGKHLAVRFKLEDAIALKLARDDFDNCALEEVED